MFCLLLHPIHAWARTATILGENAFSSSFGGGSVIVIGLVTFGTVSEALKNGFSYVTCTHIANEQSF